MQIDGCAVTFHINTAAAPRGSARRIIRDLTAVHVERSAVVNVNTDCAQIAAHIFNVRDFTAVHVTDCSRTVDCHSSDVHLIATCRIIADFNPVVNIQRAVADTNRLVCPRLSFIR